MVFECPSVAQRLDVRACGSRKEKHVGANTGSSPPHKPAPCLAGTTPGLSRLLPSLARKAHFAKARIVSGLAATSLYQTWRCPHVTRVSPQSLAPCRLQLSFEALSGLSAEDLSNQRLALQTAKCQESSHMSVIPTDLPPQLWVGNKRNHSPSFSDDRQWRHRQRRL